MHTRTQLVPTAIPDAVRDTLTAAGHHLATYRYVVLIEGLDADGHPFLTALAGDRDAETAASLTADLIQVFACSDLAVAR